jgi:hypothetical protein
MMMINQKQYFVGKRNIRPEGGGVVMVVAKPLTWCFSYLPYDQC